MVQIKRVMVGIILAAVILLGDNLSCDAEEKSAISDNPHVLFLSSYSYEWESVPKQLAGIEKTLNGYATVDYVFMDTKREAYDSVKRDIHMDIIQRAQVEPFDYVIAGDDAALTFVLEYRAELFQDIPVIFEGINDEKFATTATQDSMTTGSVEAFPLIETITLSTELQPDAIRVVGISDSTQSGQGSTEQFLNAKNKFPELEFEILNCSSLTCEQIGQSIADYGKDTILIFLMMTSDSEGNTYTNTEAVEYITKQANIPVYKADELGIGKGIAGGAVISYEEMAADAAQIVLDIENGKDISGISMQTADHYIVFDKAVLDSFHISKSRIEKLLDEDISYLNDPPGFLTEHRRVLIPAAIIILLLLLILFGSLYLFRRQKKLSVEMKNKDVMLKSLLDNIPGGVAIYQIPNASMDHIKTVYSSEGIPKLSGRTMEEYLEWIREDLFHNTVYEEDLPQMLESIQKSVPCGKPVNVQYRLKHKDGSLVWVMLSAVLINTDKNESTYYAVYSDITQQKELQEAQQKEQEAKLANQAKSQFLSTVSHDMRTPLNGILGLTELMLEKTTDTRTKEDLLQLKNSGQYLLALINDTLDISKIESGNIELHPVVCDGRRLFESIINLMQPMLDSKGILARIHKCNLTFPKCFVDIGRIEQIIMNIMGNAVKFSETGGKIDAYIENISTQDGMIIDKITIVDYGIGMSEQFLPHIFEPFQQEHSGNTTIYQGTGLGMSITKMILDLMGGKIKIESKQGKGTKVTVILPMQIATQEQIRLAKQQTKSTRFANSTLERKKILLCEDHPLNARIAIHLLESYGCQVVHTENGKEGLQCFADSTIGYFDAILMDIRMPVMDGLTAAKAIRELNREDALLIPIIAMSANAFDEDVEKSMEAGMNAHLAKPIDPNQLFQCILGEMHLTLNNE